MFLSGSGQYVAFLACNITFLMSSFIRTYLALLNARKRRGLKEWDETWQ